MDNLKTALACLVQIDPCRLDYGQWLAVGMALKDAGATLADWDAWSSRDSTRYRTNVCAAKWNGFGTAGPGRAVGVGSLVKLCRDHGGTPPHGEHIVTLHSHHHLPPKAHTKPVVDYEKARAAIIVKGGGAVDPDDADLWESSPTRIDWPLEQDTAHFLRLLYAPEEFIYIGPAYGKGPEHVKTASDWATIFEDLASKTEALSPPERERFEFDLANKYPHFIANPLTGTEGLTKSGKPSFRSDSCVAAYRFLVAEFDNISKPEQIAFFRGLKLKVSALIDTGGKSIHALLRVNARDVHEWQMLVEDRMFRHLAELGLDRACKNEARMSRLPGVRRLKPAENGTLYDTGNRQNLIWFAPDGRAVQ